MHKAQSTDSFITWSFRCDITRIMSSPLHCFALFLFAVLRLGQVVLLQQLVDCLRAPESVVDLAILSLSYRGELD